VYGELMYLEWRYGVCSHRGSVRMVALGVCPGDCVFHGSAHAFVVVFRVGDVSTVPCVLYVAAAGCENYVFGVE
jgi:hypothetical protein